MARASSIRRITLDRMDIGYGWLNVDDSAVKTEEPQTEETTDSVGLGVEDNAELGNFASVSDEELLADFEAGSGFGDSIGSDYGLAESEMDTADDLVLDEDDIDESDDLLSSYYDDLESESTDDDEEIDVTPYIADEQPDADEQQAVSADEADDSDLDALSDYYGSGDDVETDIDDELESMYEDEDDLLEDGEIVEEENEAVGQSGMTPSEIESEPEAEEDDPFSSYYGDMEEEDELEEEIDEADELNVATNSAGVVTTIENEPELEEEGDDLFNDYFGSGDEEEPLDEEDEEVGASQNETVEVKPEPVKVEPTTGKSNDDPVDLILNDLQGKMDSYKRKNDELPKTKSQAEVPEAKPVYDSRDDELARRERELEQRERELKLKQKEFELQQREERLRAMEEAQKRGNNSPKKTGSIEENSKSTVKRNDSGARANNVVEKPKKPAPAKVNFDEMSDEMLWKCMKAALERLDVRKAPVDATRINRAFGQNNVNRMRKKGYIIAVGNGYTFGVNI